MRVCEVEVSGMEEIEKKLKSLTNNADEYVDKALQKGAEVYRQEMSRRAPYNNKGIGGYKGAGHLKDHINVSKVLVDDFGEREILVGVEKGDRSNWFYAKFFEWGTSKMSARPFIQPSYNAKKEEADKVIINSLKGDLEL